MTEHGATENPPLIDERFAAGQLPSGWYTDTPRPRYAPDRWDCSTGDGVIVSLPHDAWSRLRLEAELVEVAPGATAYAGTDNRTALAAAIGGPASARHTASDGGYVIAQSATPAPISDARATVTFEWTPDRMRCAANGVELLNVPNLRRSARAGQFQLAFRRCVVRRVRVWGDAVEPIPAPPRAVRDAFPLEVCVDFNDDLMATPWTHQTFAALFRELREWGTRRVSWIDLGREADGYFDWAPLRIGEHGRETFRNVGDFFATAVRAAHAEGLELHGILKPYDMVIAGHTFPPGSEPAKRFGKIERIGGPLAWATRLAADNDHFVMSRKPSAHGPARRPVWTRIDLVKDDALPAAVTPDDVTLLVSDDNRSFRPYAGPIARAELVEDYPVYRCTPSGPVPTARTRRSRVFRLDGLQLREPFVAIQSRGAARSFINRFCDLVHVFGDGGEESHLTYGLIPRKADHVSMFELSPAAGDSPPVGPQGGFEFNRYPGAPSGATSSGGEPLNTPLALDRGEVSYIALARGKDRGPAGVLSPSFPETRALWMGWVHAMLDAGADGIDIRPGHHHSDFAWGEYGFEQPVRDEMLRRTGVDIWLTDDFDYDLWRRVRGEGWTTFIREASAAVRARGKKLTLHIDGHFDNAPGLGGAMNIVADWRVWLDERLADSVTGKALWPGSSHAREVLALAHKHNIPVTYNPYCNNFFEDRASANHLGNSPQGCHIPVDRLIAWGRESGFDGFVFYECASALRANPAGEVKFRPGAEPLREVMRRWFLK